MGRWIFPALPLTGSAEIFLFPVRSMTIVYQCIASAVWTMNSDRYHLTFHLQYFLFLLSHIIPFLATTM
jgi:hypothetical protein